MALSALFEINPGTGYGTAGEAQDVDRAGATVQCRVADMTGVVSITWTIFGTNGVATPSITNSTAEVMSFTVPAGDNQAYGIQCVVGDGAGDTDTRKSAAYVLTPGGARPFFIGETFERDSDYGVVPDLEKRVANIHEEHVYQDVDELSGGAGLTVVQSHTHSLTGNGHIFVKLEGKAVDTSDCAFYERRRVYSVTGGGNPSVALTNDPLVLETDATWDLTLATSGADIQLTATPDGTNGTVFEWILRISEVPAP